MTEVTLLAVPRSMRQVSVERKGNEAKEKEGSKEATLFKCCSRQTNSIYLEASDSKGNTSISKNDQGEEHGVFWGSTRIQGWATTTVQP